MKEVVHLVLCSLVRYFKMALVESCADLDFLELGVDDGCERCVQ